MWGLPRFGVSAAAWAMVLKTILQTILLTREMGSYQKPDWNSESLKTAWQRMRPLLLGSAYYKTDQLLDRVLASMTPIGGITLLNLAQQLYGAGNAIISKAIVSPMVPQLARHANTNDWQNFSKILHKRLLIIFGITSKGNLLIISCK